MVAREQEVEPAGWEGWRKLFWVAALYDIILGLAFFFLYGPIFQMLQVVVPNNTSYIHITAGYVFVQGMGYWFVARNPSRNVDLVKVGAIYKAIYVAIALYYLAIGQLISAVFAWFAVFDLVFLVLFVRFVMVMGKAEGRR